MELGKNTQIFKIRVFADSSVTKNNSIFALAIPDAHLPLVCCVFLFIHFLKNQLCTKK